MSWRRATAVLLAAAALAWGLTAVAPATPAQAYTLPNSRAGMGVQWYYGTQAEFDSAATQVAATGVGWTRVDLQWDLVQPVSGGPYDWGWTDKTVAAAQAKGLKVMLIVSYTPSWANGGHSDHRYYPTDVSAWSAFMTAAAQRYLPLNVTTFEIWNEPNNSVQSSPSLYTSNILIPASNAIRSVSNTLQKPVTIVTGGAASLLNTPGITDQYAWATGLYSAGAKPYFDAYGVHPYTWPGDPTVPGTFNSLQRVSEIHTTMANNGDGGKQIWVTEFGFPTRGPNSNSEAQQSDYIQKGFQVWTQSAWSSWTGPMFLYVHKDPRDDANDVEANFGLVHLNGSPKPAYSMLNTFLQTVPPAPAPPTSGYNGGTPPAGGSLINGLENVNQWNGEATRAADTANKTEGTQSIKATFTPASGTWSNFNLNIASPYVNLSTATSLKVDLRPTSQTPAGQNEPVVLKFHDVTGGVLYEQAVSRITANTWSTVTVNLAGISAANRSKIDYVDLYVWQGNTGAIAGRSQIVYGVDNLRFEAPSGVPSSGLISGLENVAQWTGEATRTADTAVKTEGAQSIKATFAVPASGWSNFQTAIASPYVNLSTATSVVFDIRATSQTPSGQLEPLQFKLHDVTGNVIYEDRVPRLTANTWTTVTIPLSAIAAANRSKLDNVDLYLWSGYTAAINGRTSVAYNVDNLRYQ